MESIVGGVCPWAAGGQGELVLGGFIQLLLASYCGLNNPSMWPKDRSSTILNGTVPDYDFIIVGSGSSGSIVARRLAEANWKVLLLEAGGDPMVESEVPSMASSLLQSRSNWGYKSEPNPNYCQGMNEQQCHIPAGRTLGGSGTINYMVYSRGNKQDYDAWEKMGNTGWGYESVMKYFKKVEKLQPLENFEEVKKDYGTEGMVSIDSFGGLVPWKDVIVEAWKETDMNVKAHMNEEDQSGIGEAYGTLNAGQRYSAAKAYLSEMEEKLNEKLHIVRNAFVTKILIDETTKRTIGVKVKVGSNEVEIKTTKEVILSAGTLNTPKILMLSGIGPKEHLEKVGVSPVLMNLPVGQYLKDHVTFPVLIQVENSLATFSREMIIQSVIKYLLQRTGPLSTIGLSEIVGFMNTQDEKNPIPDAEFLHMYAPINDTLVIPDFIHGVGFSREYAKILVDSNRNHECIFMFPTVLKPKSSGTIELKSQDPMQEPKIDMGYFSEKEDMDTMLRAIKYVEKLEKTKTFMEAGLKIKDIKLENCPYEFKSDDYWRCLIKHIATTNFHPVGTAKMGPKNDGQSVVDFKLNVHGIKGLRVVDASVMPDIVRGHTNAAAMMIGEKAADLIRQDWGGSNKDEL